MFTVEWHNLNNAKCIILITDHANMCGNQSSAIGCMSMCVGGEGRGIVREILPELFSLLKIKSWKVYDINKTMNKMLDI